MSIDAAINEYQLGHHWRSMWQALARKHEAGRLQARQDRIDHRAILANARVGRAMRAMDAARASAAPPPATFDTAPATLAGVLRAIVQDGYLSETNAARAREVLAAAESDVALAPPGVWRDEVVGLRYVEGAGMRPSVRGNPETLYLASDVHRVLAALMPGAPRAGETHTN